jgi:predicted glycoside hydrolase/deacetylase ChbG (UPF0249 family)
MAMRLLLWSSAASLAVASALPAQNRPIAERLGYPAGSRLLVIHADDLAAAHSVDAATFDALDRGAVTSASIMVPSPWISEVAAYARSHVEVERELRAQIERAHALGIRPTHLDTHMGTLLATPELMAAYVKVAREYRLPFLAPRGDPRAAPRPPLSDNDVLPDAVVIAGTEVPRDRWKDFYLNAVAHLQPGLTEMIVHLGRDDAELQAVTVDHDAFGAAWRGRDYDAVTSPEFRKALQDHHVVLVTWRELQRRAQRP